MDRWSEVEWCRAAAHGGAFNPRSPGLAPWLCLAPGSRPKEVVQRLRTGTFFSAASLQTETQARETQ